MTLDEIKSMLAEICAPYRAEGRRVWTDFQVTNQDGDVRYQITAHEFVNGTAKSVFHKFSIREENLADVIAEVRGIHAAMTAQAAADAANLASVLGIPYQQAAE